MTSPAEASFTVTHHLLKVRLGPVLCCNQTASVELSSNWLDRILVGYLIRTASSTYFAIDFNVMRIEPSAIILSLRSEVYNCFRFLYC